MKYVGFAIFYLVFIVIFSLIHYYLVVRFRQIIPYSNFVKNIISFLILVFFIILLVGRFTGNSDFINLHIVLSWIGYIWLALALYFLFTFVFIDLIRLFDVFFHFLPEKNSIAFNKLKLYAFYSIIVINISLIVFGYVNSYKIRKTEYFISTDKNLLSNKNDFNILAISDIHLGSIVAGNKLNKIKYLCNEIKPDIVLFIGDILDEAMSPIITKNIGRPLSEINAPYGVYAVLGNHEYFGGQKKVIDYIENKLGIKLLIDSFIRIDNIIIIGRNDLHSKRFNGINSKSIKQIIDSTDSKHFFIVLDHQPKRFNEALKCNMDLQISGHTHDGQFWPFSLLVRKIYEVSHGILKKNNSYLIVSSGFGTWGPPIRIGTYPEIVLINIKTRLVNRSEAN